MTDTRRIHPARSTDMAVVASIQVGGAAMRFAFLVALARVIAPDAFADLAVALSWTQVIAAAIGGGAGAYLLTSLPPLVAEGAIAEAASKYRQTVRWSVAASSVVAVAIAVLLRLLGTAGATTAGLALLAAAGLRAAVSATQESARALGALASSQFITLIGQPALAVAALGVAAALLGLPIEPLLATGALVLSLGAAWAGLHAVTRAGLPSEGRSVTRATREPVDWRPLVRLGVSSALFMWMVEGTLVLASFVFDDKVEVARMAAFVRLSVATSIAGITVSTVATSHWSKRVLGGGAPPELREALRWAAIGAATAAVAGVGLLLVSDPALRLLGEAYESSPTVLGGIVVKDVAVAAASPIFYFLVMRERSKDAARASFIGAAALLAVPVGGHLGGLEGASAGAAAAGIVWLGTYLIYAWRLGDEAR